MARNYPRFLFSNPKNTKSKGPFVVHCIFPKMICSYELKGKDVVIQPLDFWDECTEEEANEVLEDMAQWIRKQNMITSQNKFSMNIDFDKIRVGNRFKDILVDGFNVEGVFQILAVDDLGRPKRLLRKKYDELEPIPLTQEIIHSCGKQNEELIFYKHSDEKNLWVINIDNSTQYFRYLHELQNIYEDAVKEPLQVPLDI